MRRWKREKKLKLQFEYEPPVQKVSKLKKILQNEIRSESDPCPISNKKFKLDQIVYDGDERLMTIDLFCENEIESSTSKDVSPLQHDSYKYIGILDEKTQKTLKKLGSGLNELDDLDLQLTTSTQTKASSLLHNNHHDDVYENDKDFENECVYTKEYEYDSNEEGMDYPDYEEMDFWRKN